MSPVELGAAMDIDEDHHGGRTTTNNSMHTLGLAVDIRYVKNPWVAGQHGNDGKPNRAAIVRSKSVSRNVSRLLRGTDEAWTPAWLHSLGTDPARTTDSVYTEIQQRQTSLQAYLSLQNDTAALTDDHCTPASRPQSRARDEAARDHRGGSRRDGAEPLTGRPPSCQHAFGSQPHAPRPAS